MISKQTIELPSDDVLELICGGGVDNFELIEDKLIDVDDHGDSNHCVIIQDTRTSKYYRLYYVCQRQNGMMFSDDSVEILTEVLPIQKTITVWKDV